MRKKKVLLQIYNFIYFFYGLSAIKSSLSNIDLDILIIHSNENPEDIINFLKDFKEISHIYFYTTDDELIMKKLTHIPKIKIMDKWTFKHFKMIKIKKFLLRKFNSQIYDEIFYCHEHRIGHYISLLNIAYPNAKYTMYGDGQGIFCSTSSNYMGSCKYEPHPYLHEIIPDAAIGLLPTDVEDFFTNNKIPLTVINKNIVLDSLSRVPLIKKMVTNYLKFLNKEYPNLIKAFLMTSCLAEVGEMSLENEINMNIDIIKTFFPLGSLVIVKPHPREQISKINIYKNILKNEYKIIEFDKHLKTLPIEVMPNFISQCSYFVTYGTSSITLKYLYGINHIDTREILQKYGKTAVSEKEKIFDESLKKLESWNGKGLIYNKYYKIKESL